MATRVVGGVAVAAAGLTLGFSILLGTADGSGTVEPIHVALVAAAAVVALATGVIGATTRESVLVVAAVVLVVAAVISTLAIVGGS